MARIIVNPKVFSDSRDAKCVVYNEALRLVMEEMDFNPVSEPTDEQRKFFADTAYADDELMLRRTTLARICVFDTSVKNPTDGQLQEAVEFLEAVMQSVAPQNEEEQSVVQRAHDIIAGASRGPRQGQEAQGAGAPPEPQGEPVQEGTPSGVRTEVRSEPRTTASDSMPSAS